MPKEKKEGHRISNDLTLTESEVFRQLTKIIHDGIIVHVDKRIVFVNKAGLELFRAVRDKDMIGRNIMDFVHPEYKERVKKRIERALSNSTPLTFDDQKIIRCDGQELDVEAVSAPLKYNGEPAVMVLLRDISRFKKSQEALLTSEENYRTIFNNVNDAIFLHDPVSGKILDVNQRMCEMFSCTHDEALKLDIGQISEGKPPYSLEEAVEWVQKAFKSGLQIFEWRCKDRNGRLFWGEVNLKRVVISSKPMVIAIVRDITKRKLADQQIRDSERQYRLIINALADAVHVVDRDLKITFVNNALTSWLKGLELKTDITGKTVPEVFPFLSKEVFKEYEKVFKTGKILVTEETNNIDQRLIITETRKIPIIVGGEVNQVMTVIRDITQSKLASDALKKSEETLSSIFRAAPVGIGLVSNRVFIKVNERIIEMTGYTREELIGQSARILYESDKEFNRVGKVKYGQIYRRGYGTIETRWISKDGQLFDILLSSAALDPADLSAGVTFTALDITDRKRALKDLQDALKQMEEDQRALSEKNVTLREVLSQIENEKKEIQDQIQANVNKVLLPMLINLQNHLSKEGQEYLQLFKKNLQDITSPFVNKLDVLYSKLTPREIEVCNMIKNGMPSKDIATTLRVSIETIHKTRYNIRKKLNILHEDVNLTSFLKTL